MRFVVTAGLAASGEVVPFVSVAAALRRRGHDVSFIGNPFFGGRATESGLRFIPVGAAADYDALQQDASLFGSERADGREILRRYQLPLVGDYYRAVESEIRASPAVVISNETGSALAAERYGRPLVAAVLSPARLGSRFDPPHPERVLPAWASRLTLASHARFAHLTRAWQGGAVPVAERPVVPPGSPVAALRATVGLVPFDQSDFRPRLMLCLWPDWFGARQPDWPAAAVTCGFLLDRAPAISGLEGLPIDETRPTVVATTGSLATSQDRFFSNVAGACQGLGWGAVLVTPHREHVPQALPAHVIHVASAPFGALFPRAAVVIHHGGIGTMALALAAGVPQIISPLRGEQFDIGYRAVRLGVARMMSVPDAGTEALACALRRVGQSAPYTRACEHWRARLDGYAECPSVVDRLERLASHDC
jgi:rhamnosyltransferase subunit B